jgi:hypothetical protein
MRNVTLNDRDLAVILAALQMAPAVVAHDLAKALGEAHEIVWRLTPSSRTPSEPKKTRGRKAAQKVEATDA